MAQRSNDRKAGLILAGLGVVLVLLCGGGPYLWLQSRSNAEAKRRNAGAEILNSVPLPSDWQRGPVRHHTCSVIHVLWGCPVRPAEEWSQDVTPPWTARADALATLDRTLGQNGWQPCPTEAPSTPDRASHGCWRNGNHELVSWIITGLPCDDGFCTYSYPGDATTVGIHLRLTTI